MKAFYFKRFGVVPDVESELLEVSFILKFAHFDLTLSFVLAFLEHHV